MNEYPCLKVSRNGLMVVLFTAPKTGINVLPSSSMFKHYSENWLEYNFTPFTGSIELKNPDNGKDFLLKGNISGQVYFYFDSNSCIIITGKNIGKIYNGNMGNFSYPLNGSINLSQYGKLISTISADEQKNTVDICSQSITSLARLNSSERVIYVHHVNKFGDISSELVASINSDYVSNEIAEKILTDINSELISKIKSAQDFHDLFYVEKILNEKSHQSGISDVELVIDLMRRIRKERSIQLISTFLDPLVDASKIEAYINACFS